MSKRHYNELVKHKSTPTITVELGGGLGNQIFGFIAGVYAQELTGLSLQLDFRQVSYSHNRKFYDLRSFVLPCACVDSRYSQTKMYRSTRAIKDSLHFRSQVYRSVRAISRDIFTDQSEPWVEETNSYFGKISRNTLIIGPHANFSYIDKLEELLAKRVTLALKEESRWLKEKTSEMHAKSPICVHVRRGDYIGLEKSLSRIGLLSSEYYSNGIRHIAAKTNQVTVWVFSDSPQESRLLSKQMNLSSEFEIEFVTPPIDHDPAESLILQSRADSNVIGNSSFSHWAARLNQTSKMTVYPSHYYFNSSNEMAHKYSNWVSIPSSWEAYDKE